MGAVAARIEGHGTSEAAWDTCAWLAALPTVDAATVFADARRLWVVSPHPDDEVLACGGLIQAATAHGLSVMVVSVTDGEACYPGQSQWPQARLRDVRRRELANAMQALGLDATHVTSLALPDGEVAAHEHRLAAALAMQLSAGDLVLAPWLHDAHPDHEAVGRAARSAAAGCGARLLQYPVWAWHWLDPHSASAPWPQAGRVGMCAATQARKLKAMAAFASQTGDVPGLECEPILPPHVLARFRRCFEVVIA